MRYAAQRLKVNAGAMRHTEGSSEKKNPLSYAVLSLENGVITSYNLSLWLDLSLPGYLWNISAVAQIKKRLLWLRGGA